MKTPSGYQSGDPFLRCSTCVFWRRTGYPVLGRDGDLVDDRLSGVCHREPRMPNMVDDNWCAEWWPSEERSLSAGGPDWTLHARITRGRDR